MQDSALTDLLAKCSSSAIQTMLHGIVDGMCNKQANSYCDFSDVFTLLQWWEVQDQCRQLLVESSKNQLTKDQIMTRVDGLDDQKKQVICEVIHVREEDIRLALLQKTNKIATSYLQDFDWQIKLALSSDKLALLQQPLMSLELELQNSNNKTKKMVELDIHDLQSLITSMEAANRVVGQNIS